MLRRDYASITHVTSLPVLASINLDFSGEQQREIPRIS